MGRGILPGASPSNHFFWEYFFGFLIPFVPCLWLGFFGEVDIDSLKAYFV